MTPPSKEIPIKRFSRTESMLPFFAPDDAGQT